MTNTLTRDVLIHHVKIQYRSWVRNPIKGGSTRLLLLLSINTCNFGRIPCLWKSSIFNKGFFLTQAPRKKIDSQNIFFLFDSSVWICWKTQPYDLIGALTVEIYKVHKYSITKHATTILKYTYCHIYKRCTFLEIIQSRIYIVNKTAPANRSRYPYTDLKILFTFTLTRSLVQLSKRIFSCFFHDILYMENISSSCKYLMQNRNTKLFVLTTHQIESIWSNKTYVA